MHFLKTLLASLTALFIFSLIVFFIGMGVVSVMTSKEKVVVKENSVLKIDLNVPLTEKEVENPLGNLSFTGSANASIGLVSLVQTIQQASEDENIKGIMLRPGMFFQGYSGIEELRQSLIQFRDSGKFVISYAEDYSEKGYYLATAADEVYLSPEGYFEFNGLSATVMFFKNLFEKWDVHPEIFRVGEYKSAVEPFIREDLSEENREQLNALLGSLNGHILREVSKARNIDLQTLSEISDQMKASDDSDAIALKLVDGLKYKDEVNDIVREKLGLEEGDDLNVISYGNYKNVPSGKYASDHIAIVIAEGEIVPGNSPDALSSGYITKYLKKVREDDRVKAVVLRINSPGGEMQASELIWREVQLTSEKKPVVASFSDYAASGGYYIAMGADTIVAEPTTITGSIGIFGMMINLGEMMEKHIGITTDQVNTGQFSGMMSLSRPLNEAERSIIQNHVEKGYDTFITRVANGRNASPDDIRKVASGRVWTGSQGKENGLVDVLGGLQDAIKIAAEMSDLEEYKVVSYPEKRNILEELLEMDKNKEDALGVKYFGDSYFTFKKIKNLATYQGIQARMPFEITIE